MTSPKQVDANRRNAKRSIGPKTMVGKVLSKLNAVKHGLTSDTIVIRGESAENFDAMRDELVKEFAPATVLASQYVERLVEPSI